MRRRRGEKEGCHHLLIGVRGGWGGGEELEYKVGQQKFLRHLESTLKLSDTRKENLFEAKPEFSKHSPGTLINGHGG